MALSDNTRGALLMMASMAAFTLNDTFIKSVSDELPLAQAVFLRGVGTTVLIAIVGLFQGGIKFGFSHRDWQITGIRTLAEVGATACFLTALFHMPLANVTAILQSLPLAITFVGALFFGEKVGWRRYGAIAVGLAGVLMIVKPGSDGFSSYSLLAMLAVAFVVVRDLSTRRLSSSAPSLTVAFVTAIVITTLAGIITATGEWHPVSPRAAGFLAGASLFIIGGYLLSIMVMRVGEIAVVSPFRYTALVWAIVLGFLAFGDIPDLWTLIGSGIVVGMGVFTFYREHKLKSG